LERQFYAKREQVENIWCDKTVTPSTNR
jgi:hypothetical protein